MPNIRTSYSNQSGSGFEIDASDWLRKVEKLYRMGELRRRDIAKAFKDADKTLISKARSLAGRSSQGVKYSRYQSRVHPAGQLKRGIGFAVSKKRTFVYYVRSKAYYTQMHIMGSEGGTFGKVKGKRGGYSTLGKIPKAAYIPGFGWSKKIKGYAGNPFMERAINATEATVISSLQINMAKLTEKEWQNG